MTAVTNKVFKGSESWLTKERQKVENFSEENFQKFSTECQQEVDWLRNYLQDIISPKPKQKHKKPEIKSLILAAAAAKREQEKQEKRNIKAKEWEIARQRAKGKNIDTKKKKVDQIQDNILSKKKPAILEQNKIPSNVQLIEQLKQFGGKIHEKTLHSEKQIELPEIDSDYSSNEEEVKTKHQQQRKGWEQSPELKTALIRQASIDPETIFGKITQLNVEEIFKGREHRLRPRSSSANWSGLDGLTEEEELEYKIRMGFL